MTQDSCQNTEKGPDSFVLHCSGTVFLKVIEIFFLNQSLAALQCCISAVQQGESAIHTHISLLCHHTALRKVPCAIQLVLINYLFYIQKGIHVNPSLPIHPTRTSPPTPWVFICLFSMSMSQFLLCKQVHLQHFSRCTYMH